MKRLLLIAGVIAGLLIAAPAQADAAYLYKSEAKHQAAKRIRTDNNRDGEHYFTEFSGSWRYSRTRVGFDYYTEFYDAETDADWYCEGEMVVRETSSSYFTNGRGVYCDFL